MFPVSVCTVLKAVHMLIMSVCIYLKCNFLQVLTLLLQNKRLEQWVETGCRPVISLADLEVKEFSWGTGPHRQRLWDFPPGHREIPQGYSGSSDIDVMWKKAFYYFRNNKLNDQSLSSCVCSRVSFQSIKVLLQRWVWETFSILSGLCLPSLSSLLWLCFCWQAFAEVRETHVYAAQSVRGPLCGALAVQSVEIHERKPLSRYFKWHFNPHLI